MKKVLAIALSILSSASLYAIGNGSQWIYTGTAPSVNGMGYSGVAGLDYGGGFFVNPANPAFVHRFRTFGQFGLGTTNVLIDLGVNAPLQIGTLTAAFRSVSVSSGIGGVMTLDVGHSKMITDDFAFGFSAYFINHVSATSQTGAGFGLNLGTVLRLNKAWTNKTGLGFSDTKWGISFMGLGLPSTLDSTTPLPGIIARTGLSSRIMDFKIVALGANVDISLGLYPFYAMVNTGLKLSLAEHFHLTGGFLYGMSDLTGTNGLANYTLGASFSWEFGETPVEIFYSYNPYNFSGGGSTHFIGAEIAFGLPDTKGPDTEIEFQGQKDTETVYFSPNYDGSQDRVVMDIGIRDTSLIKDWNMKIYDHRGDEVKKIEAPLERDVTLDMKLFWKRLWAKKEAVAIPHTIEWDGTSQDGFILPDGEYKVKLDAVDELKNEGNSVAKTIRLDLTPPSAQLGIDFKLFSPNGDGNQDKVEIRQELSPGDMWKADIRDSQGNIVQHWEWKENPPSALFWEGKDKDGKILPDGSYDYIVYGSDLAGNRTILAINTIMLNTKKQFLGLEPLDKGFSPNGDKRKDEMIFKPQISDTEGLEQWDLVVMDSEGRIVRKITGTTMPSTLSWNGKEDSGMSAPDGKYKAQLLARYNNGNRPQSDTMEFMLDTLPPQVQYSTAPELFSPDNDGENDLLTINLDSSDESGIKDWKLTILDPDDKPFKTFSGTGKPASQIYWDGKSEKGEPVESAQDYKVKLSISDELGNRIKDKDMDSIPVDVLVEATPRGLKIRISNIEFAFGKSSIKGKGFIILNRVAQILRKYKNYEVEISGHTDNVGTEEANLKLSKARAEAVRDYLVSKGISSKRLITKGYAFQFPVADNSTDSGRRKNRRVEFMLIKKR